MSDFVGTGGVKQVWALTSRVLRWLTHKPVAQGEVNRRERKTPAPATFVSLFLVLGCCFSLNQCSTNPACIGEVGDTGRDPNQQPCTLKCECNNQRYTGQCVEGTCRSTPRQSCTQMGAIRSCQPLSGACNEGQQICFPSELITRMWGDCRCAAPSAGEREAPDHAGVADTVHSKDTSHPLEGKLQEKDGLEKQPHDNVVKPGCVCSDCSFYRHLRKVEGDNEDLTATAIHSDSKTLALLFRNPSDRLGSQILRLVDLTTGQSKRDISFSGYYLCKRVVFLPNGKSILALLNKEIRMWDVQSGRLQAIFSEERNQAFTGFAVSHDSNYLFTSSSVIRMWSLKDRKVMKTYTIHPTGASRIAVSPNGHLAASQSGQTVLVWELGTSRVRYTFKGVSSSAQLTFSPDSVWLAATKDTTTLWNLTTGETLVVPVPASYPVPVGFQQNSSVLAVATQQGVYVWDRSSKQTLLTLRPTRTEVSSLAFYNKDSTLAVVEWGKYVSHWSIPSGTLKQVQSFRQQGHLQPIAAMDFSPTGEQLVTSSLDATALIWDTGTGQLQHTLLHPSSAILGAVFPKHREFVATLGLELHLWDPRSGKNLKSLSIPSRTTMGRLTYRPNSDVVALTEGGVIELWDSKKESRVRILDGHQDSIKTLAFSPQGNFLASTSEKKVLLWDPDTGLIQHTISFSQPILSLDVNPTGSLLAMGLADGTTHLWNVIQKKTAHVFRTQPVGRGTHCVDFHPSGQLLMTCNRDILLWDLSSKTLVQTLKQDGVTFTRSRFHPLQNRIISASLRNLHYWTCNPP